MPNLSDIVLGLTTLAVLIVSAWYVVWDPRYFKARERKFKRRFAKAFDFFPPRKGTDDLAEMEQRIVTVIEVVGAEAVMWAGELEHKKKSALKEGANPIWVKLMSQESEIAERKKAEYKELRQLARKAGYSRKLLKEIDQRIPELIATARADRAS